MHRQPNRGWPGWRRARILMLRQWLWPAKAWARWIRLTDSQWLQDAPVWIVDGRHNDSAPCKGASTAPMVPVRCKTWLRVCVPRGRSNNPATFRRTLNDSLNAGTPRHDRVCTYLGTVQIYLWCHDGYFDICLP
ncbi:hypothetical protein V8C42DRAFT_320707 [Trichoderma barbatum]